MGRRGLVVVTASSPITVFDGVQDGAGARPARRRPRSRATGGGRGRGPRRRRRAAGDDGAGGRRRLAAAARRSSARAAVSTSMATTRVSPSTERRSLRAADQPIDTWSSCIALEGIESTLAGTASRLSSETIAAWVYCAIMWPLSTPGSSARNGGSPWLRARSRNRSRAPLADRGDVGGDDREEVEHVGDRGAVEVAVGLDPALLGEHHRVVDGAGRARARRRARRARRCRGRRRAPAASSAASRRPAPGCSRPSRCEATIAGVGQQRASGWPPTAPGPGAAGAPGARRRRPGRCRAAPRRSSPRRCRRCAAASAGR